jgi:hypothetical protein
MRLNEEIRRMLDPMCGQANRRKTHAVGVWLRAWTVRTAIGVNR